MKEDLRHGLARYADIWKFAAIVNFRFKATCVQTKILFHYSYKFNYCAFLL